MKFARALAALLGDARYWLEHETYAPDELAVRFHHRLVFIHPFANGNGRHARLMADVLAQRQDRPVLLGVARIWCTPGTFVNVTLTRYARPMRTISAPFSRSRALENLTEEYLRTYSRPELVHQRSLVNLRASSYKRGGS